METEFEWVPGKNINTKYLYMKNEKYLYRPVNQTKSGKRFQCYEKSCSAGITLREPGGIKHSKVAHIEHSVHEEEKERLKAVRELKEKCRSVDELLSNRSISTRAIFDTHSNR